MNILYIYIFKANELMFAARWYASAAYVVMRCLCVSECVCLSVCLSPKFVHSVKRNKRIGDDTKAAARQSLNCIKNKKKYLGF